MDSPMKIIQVNLHHAKEASDVLSRRITITNSCAKEDQTTAHKTLMSASTSGASVVPSMANTFKCLLSPSSQELPSNPANWSSTAKIKAPVTADSKDHFLNLVGSQNEEVRTEGYRVIRAAKGGYGTHSSGKRVKGDLHRGPQVSGGPEKTQVQD